MEKKKYKEVVFEPVKSSQITHIGYTAEDETMWVKFKSRMLYSYHPVRQEQYNEFKESDSKGSYFHSNFKTNPEMTIKNEYKPEK